MSDNEEVFEELSEKEQLASIIEDASARLEEISDEEAENTEGGGNFGRTYRRTHNGKAYCSFYRLMLSTCPGTVTNISVKSSGLTWKRSGSTAWFYRNNTCGKKTAVITSTKGTDTYITTLIIDFK